MHIDFWLIITILGFSAAIVMAIKKNEKNAKKRQEDAAADWLAEHDY